MNESGVIDLKQILLGNVKLLITIPLLVAVGVFVVVNQLPRTYVSVSYLDVMGDVKYADAIMRSPLVLESTPIKELNETGKKELERKFKFNTSKLDQRDKPPFVLFEVRDNSPEGAKVLANALIDAWLAANKPKGAAKLELERKLSQGRAGLTGTLDLISRFNTEANKIIVPNARYDFAESIVKLHARRDDLQNLIIDLEKKLEGATRQLVIAEPTLPKEPVKNNATVYGMLAMISCFLVLLLGLIFKKSIERR